MSDLPTTQHRPGWAAPMGEPAPDDELELRPEHARFYTDEQPNEPGPEQVPADDGGNVPPDRPHLVQPARPSPDYPDDESLWRDERESQISQGGVVARPPGAPPSTREHVEYHVFLTEKRGASRWRPRNVLVQPNFPIQVLGYNENRRRAVITASICSADGYFVALGPQGSLEAAVGKPTNLSAVPPDPVGIQQAYLLPLLPHVATPGPLSPQSLVVEHCREVFGLFITDSALTNVGQFAILSISEEVGDDLSIDEELEPGTGGDR